MSAVIGGSDGVRASTSRMRSVSSVAETTQIGDGPQVRRPRPNRPNATYRVSDRLLTALEQRLRTGPLHRAALMRKLRLLRSLKFYSGLRGSHSVPAAVFGYHPAANINHPVFGNWYGIGTLPNQDEDEEVEEQQDRRHWEPAQLHFQQYLGQRTHYPPRSFSLNLSDLRLVGGLLCGLGLSEALRLALNEVFHLFNP